MSQKRANSIKVNSLACEALINFLRSYNFSRVTHQLRVAIAAIPN
ncbi:hypothetical protein [Rivularia sp. UHCC 0363]|nr:hypothetical protein [Rivularia sp. UHCC 0363]MEA5596763.1 hypothetical protein [Rivularia sp. UHCC 0363]